MKVVKVYGALQNRLGQSSFEFDVTTPAQALRGLCANFPDLAKWMIDSEKDGVGYKVSVGNIEVTEEDVSPLLLPYSDREVFSITPVIAGAGGGVGRILLGVALIAVAIAAPGAGFALSAGGFTTAGVAASGAVGVIAPGFALASTLAAAAGNIGIGLVLSGVAEVLSPQPKPPSFDDSNPSFSFSNIVNTSRQGLPVPIIYGRVFAGSAVLSANFNVDNI